jgi:hypothetical protein
MVAILPLGRIKFRQFATNYDLGFPMGVLQPGSILYLPFSDFLPKTN